MCPSATNSTDNNSTLTDQSVVISRYKLVSWVQRQRRHRNGAIVVVALALFTDMVLYDVIVPILPALVKRVGVDSHKVGFLFATYAVGVLSFAPVFGICSDNVKSSKIPMVIGQAGLAVSTLLFAHANHYYILIMARFFQGVAAAATWTLGFALLADTYPTDSLGSATGAATSMSSLGYFVGPLLGGVLSQIVSLEAPFWVCAFIAVIAMILRIFINPPKVSSQGEHQNESAILSEPTSGTMSTASLPHAYLLHDTSATSLISYPASPNVFAQMSTNQLRTQLAFNNHMPTIEEERDLEFGYLFSLQEIAVCGSVISITAGSFAAVETLLANHLERLFGYTPLQVSLVMMAYVIPCSLFSNLGGKWSDKYDRYSIMSVCLVVFAATHIMLGQSTSLSAFVASSVAYSAAWAAALAPAFPEMAAVVTRHGRDSYGKVYSISNIYYAIGMLIGPIFAEIFNRLFGFNATMIIVAIVTLTFSPILIWTASKSRHGNLHSQKFQARQVWRPQ